MGEIRSSICVLDCPDSCSLEVEVENGRVVGIDGGMHVDPVAQVVEELA